MSTIKLTISIVSANRPKRLETCLKRLSCLPGIDKVKIQLFDNSKFPYGPYLKYDQHGIPNIIRYDYTEHTLSNEGINLTQSQRFIKSRNDAIELCDTEYFTILDDDDYYSVDAIGRMLFDIDVHPDADMISYNCIKEGRFPTIQPNAYQIHKIGKLSSLNSFDNYLEDRETKVYLWNCGTVFRTSLLSNFEWKFYGCDDILPITRMYLESEVVYKVNYPIYYYPYQATICDEDVKKDVGDLENKMYKSYEELLETYTTPYQRKIIKKALSNSIRQLEYIDHHKPEQLITLMNNPVYVHTESKN